MRKHRGFTIVELMVVISIIMLLISFLLPSLAEARDHARYAKWAGYSHNMRVHPNLLIYHNFEQQGVAGPDMGWLWNRSTLDAMDMARRDMEPEYFHSRFMVGSQPQGGNPGANKFSPDTQPGRRWKRGRWRSKDALEFDNQGSVTITDHDPSMNFEREPGHSWTLMVWANSANVESYDGIVTKGRTKRDSYALKIQESGTDKATLKTETAKNSSGGNFTTDGNLTFEEGQWFHAALLYDGLKGSGEYRMYINGRLDKVTPRANCEFDNKQQLILGCDNPGTVEYWEGRIDEVALFSGALSGTKILEHYEIGRPRRQK